MSGFDDLRTRVISGIVLAVVGLAAVWVGGAVFLGLLALAGAAMTWELVRMLGPKVPNIRAVALAVVAAAALLRSGFDAGPLTLAALLIAPLFGMIVLKRDRALFFVYLTAILFAIAFLYQLRQSAGLGITFLLILVVAATDMGGYFFGRIVGGPKLWPAVSPKKTWSGTIGGWFAAMIATLAYLGATDWNYSTKLLALAVLSAIASQVGDIVESAVKRHAGVKDSSNLIPGHGGVLDRFDALLGAILFLMTAVIVAPALGWH